MTTPGVDIALGLIGEELDEATKKFGPFASPHEGIAIILEEFIELMLAVFWGKGDPMREATQVGAMAARFLVDCSGLSQAAEEPEPADPIQRAIGTMTRTVGEKAAALLGLSAEEETTPVDLCTPTQTIAVLSEEMPGLGDPRGRSPGAVLFKVLAEALKKADEQLRALTPIGPGDQIRKASAVNHLTRAYGLVRDVTDALDGAAQGGNDGDSTPKP